MGTGRWQRIVPGIVLRRCEASGRMGKAQRADPDMISADDPASPPMRLGTANAPLPDPRLSSMRPAVHDVPACN
jgi:hypothetical protein